jgi:Spy/CpxP family protein refolding chaperone
MTMMRWLGGAVALALAAFVFAQAPAQDGGAAGGYGPGMMGGSYGPGMMGGGYGPGMMGGGYGPGMMGGGYGPGMMGGGYGPGMMGGGYGPGMMGGGYGPGMMGGGYGAGMMGRGPGMGRFAFGIQDGLRLSDDQRKKLQSIHDELQGKQWDVAGKMRVEAIKMRDLMNAEMRDKAALDATFKRISDLRLERFDANLAAREQMEKLLTAEQRQQVRGWGHWWTGDDD